MQGLVLNAKWDPRPDYKVTDWEKSTGKAITGSSIWRNPELKVVDVPEPKIGPDDVLLKVKACGVCGSDLHMYETTADGYIYYPGLTKFPVVLGHELSGQVVEVGKNVQNLKRGDMVTAEEMMWCGHCTPCRNGYPNQCLNLEEIGFTVNGAFADHIAVNAKYCWKINALAEHFGSEDKAYEAGATVEPCCVAYNAIFIRAGGFKPGGYVAIFGAGPIGLHAVGLCKTSGASKIIVFEVSPQRREICKQLGADYVFDPQATPAHEVMRDVTGGEGCDLLVEAAGVPLMTFPEMERSMAVNGRIVSVARTPDRVPVYLEYFQVGHAQFFGAQGHSGNGCFPNVIRLMAAGRHNPLPMITGRYDLNGVVNAIKESRERKHGKIMVKM
jgi:threonine dehydrogenase-like Zn-dependent dehydrogenase